MLTLMEIKWQFMFLFFFQAEDGIRDPEMSRGLGDVYKRQILTQPSKVLMQSVKVSMIICPKLLFTWLVQLKKLSKKLRKWNKKQLLNE